MKDRLDTINCCLCDVGNVLRGGFEMGNVWYTEPKTLDVAFDVISDVVMSAAAQQYGGFTVPRVDTILAYYAEKSYESYCNEYLKILLENEIIDDPLSLSPVIEKKMDKYAAKKVYRDFEQGFQSWEMVFNTVGSSRGDYPFITISFGVDTSRWGIMASIAALRVRKGGQGKKGKKKAVLFPKLTFLYDENLHGKGKQYEFMFDEAIECSKKAMYPDYLSLTGNGYIPSIYKKYGQVISLMGCRASLSPWYVRGGMHPADEDDYPVFEGRCNLGAITLHLCMILAKAREENKDFYEVLDYYLGLIRNLHKRTFTFLSEKKASTNPIMFMQGGLLNGNLKANDKIGELLRPMTMSFGITALNELQVLYNGKTICEDGQFALEVMQYINDKVNEFKEEDNILYAIYGTPAESLCGLQIEQFRNKYGIIEGVSSREYVSNSFHCGVWEDITPIEKQDYEERFYHLFNGGKIQYCKYPINYNTEAMKILVRRGLDKGFYEGVNEQLSYCDDCGHEELNMTEKCSHCGSENLTIEDRMNGYLGYTKVNGKSRYNKAKLIEIKERVSM
jgi:ribonucleoside-triphosphate reductase